MSIIRHPEQRVAVIIDTQNLYHSAKNLYKSKVNFANVLKAALGDRKLIRAVAYVVNTESGEEQPFFEALADNGFSEFAVADVQAENHAFAAQLHTLVSLCDHLHGAVHGLAFCGSKTLIVNTEQGLAAKVDNMMIRP